MVLMTSVAVLVGVACSVFGSRDRYAFVELGGFRMTSQDAWGRVWLSSIGVAMLAAGVGLLYARWRARGPRQQ